MNKDDPAEDLKIGLEAAVLTLGVLCPLLIGIAITNLAMIIYGLLWIALIIVLAVKEFRKGKN